MTKIAVLQLTTTSDLNYNLIMLEKYIRLAVENKADHIFTPENSDVMLPHSLAKEYDFLVSYQKMITLIAYLSNNLKVFIHIGSIKVPADNGKYYNQSITFDKNGIIVACYNKIHLFDAVVGDGTHYYESQHIQAGDNAVIHQCDDLKIGYTICYDIRFGYLFNILSNHNVDVITAPAAFTVPTGKAHWEILLRSRAIENCCYIVASAQCGVHYAGRQTYGHAMIINPWGEIIISADSDSEMIIYADIDKKQRDKIKKQLNIVAHRIENIGIINT